MSTKQRRPRRRYDSHPLRERIDRLPQAPGVYLMKDATGRILYVGKAVNLRARVRTYFNGGDGRRRMHQLMKELAQLEVSLATDEREALLLEARLIRQHQPKYNIALKGSARPACLRIDLSHPYPRLERGPAGDDGAHYFGPLPSSWHAAQLHATLERLYPLRTCDDAELRRTRRPCLQFQLKRCLAPCAGYVTPDAYRTLLDQVMEVLEGGEERLAQQLRLAMSSAAERLEFEQAAWLRDRLNALEGLQARQPAPVAGNDRDVIGLARVADEVAIAVMPVRWGRQQQARLFYFDGQLENDAELLETFLLQHYQVSADLPLEIGLPFPLPDPEAMASILLERAERPLRLSQPPDAAGLDRVAVAAALAEMNGVRDEADRAARGAETLARLLNLRREVHTIEWLQVDLEARAAHRLRMRDGALEPGSARRHAVRSPGRLEPASTGQAGSSRGTRLELGQAIEAVLSRRAGTGPVPDVLALEGGKAALQAASSALKGTPWEGVALVGFPVESPSREDGPIEEGAAEGSVSEVMRLYLPGRRNPVRLPPHSPARRLLHRLREAGRERISGISRLQDQGRISEIRTSSTV